MIERANPVAALGKIVILMEDFARRGSVRQGYLLARELRKKHGLDVEIWGLSTGELSRVFEAEAIPTRSVGFMRPCCPVGLVRKSEWALGLTKIAIALRRARVNVLLPFGSLPNVVAGLSYAMGGVQTCVWGERGGYRVVGERTAAHRCRQFIANSRAGIEHLIRALGVPEHRVTYIPNAVEQPVLTPGADWRARLGLSSGQLLVVKLADLGSDRDHATVLRAWRNILADWPGVGLPVLALAGSFGDVYPECQRMVRESGVDQSVRFLGRLTDPQALIAHSDLAVFSSRAEGMPNSVLEYMAAGKAVVASDLPGIRDALGPGRDHVLFRPGDVGRCADLITNLLQNATARTAIGEANRDRARREFSVERIAAGYLDTILGNASSAASFPAVENARVALAPAQEDA